MSDIRKKFFFQLLYAFSQAAFPLITYPYITRTIGAAGLGAIGYIEYVSGFIITIASFGIPFYGVREVARWQNQPEKKAAVLRQLFSFHFLVSIIGCGVFIGLIKANHHQPIPTPLIGLGCLNILLPPFIAEWFMQGNEAFVFTTVRGILLRLAGLVAMFVFVASQKDYIIYYLIIVTVQLAVALTNMYKSGGRNFIPRAGISKLPLKTLWHFFLTTSVISVYVFFDVLILGWVANDVHVGYYTIAIKIVKLSLAFVLSLNVILFPRLSYLHANNHTELVLAFIKKSMQFVLLLTVPLLVLFYLLAPHLVVLLAGPAFAPSVLLVQILSGLPLVIGFSNLLVFQVLLPFGKEKSLLYCVVGTCTGSLIFHGVLAGFFLERGTAWATLLTETLMTSLTAFVAYKTIAIKFPFRTLAQSAAACLPFIGLFFLFERLNISDLTLIVLCVLPGMLFYGILQLALFKNPLLFQLWTSLKISSWRAANG